MHKQTKNNRDEFKQTVHDMWDAADDEMDRLELKHFVDDHNMPRIAELNGTDENIGVEEVLVIGGYMVLNKLHNDLHEGDADEIKDKIEAMFDGKVRVETVLPENMPDELKEMLTDIVEVVKKNRKKNDRKPRGKK